MNDERWRRVEEICHDALERPGHERAEFIHTACAGDESMRVEVASLLANQSRADALGTGLGIRDVGLGLIGTQLGVYQVVSLLGAGGMGEVYRARDTKLGRDVAIKALPAAFTADADRGARFERESRVLASLNHPHIGAIYGFEESNGLCFLILELIDGPTLADRIARDSLTMAETLTIARQIAEALDAAHEKGIVHRDLKPANIKLTADGAVKVLDFGLAKLIQLQDVATTVPAATAATHEGAILGTPAYMSPEQARGLSVDKRTDIWAFGCVVFEMLVGRQAFPGATVSDCIAAVLEREPDWSALPNATPPAARGLLLRCLEKDPKRRLRDIGDAQREFDDALEQGNATAVSASSRVWIAAAVLGLLTAITVSVIHFRETPARQQTLLYEISAPENETIVLFAISPDGRHLAFTTGRLGAPPAANFNRLWVRPFDSLEAKPLRGTEGAWDLFWSADSRSIGFFAQGKLKRVDLLGGPPQIVCDAPLRSAGAWNQAGNILFTGARGALYKVSEADGEVHPATTLDALRQEVTHRFPQFLPDGRRFIYTAFSSVAENSGVYAASLDSNETTRLLGSTGNVVYSEDASGQGYLLFLRGEALLAQRFDPTRLELRGEPFPVAEDVAARPLVGQGLLLGHFSSSASGILSYQRGRPSAKELVWLDRSGRRLSTVGEPADYSNIALSADEHRVAVSRLDPRLGTRDVWIVDLSRSNVPKQLTFDRGDDMNPVWSPDGNRIAFSSSRSGPRNVYLKDANGAGDDQALFESDVDKNLADWSTDGRYVLWAGGAVLPVHGERRPVPLPPGTASPRVSPDGRWLAYQSVESGALEIYVQSFPALLAGRSAGKWRVSAAGGIHPEWRRDGHEIFYLTPNSTLMAVSVQASGAAFEHGVPTPLFPLRVEAVDRRAHYQPTANGQRFLVVQPIEQASSNTITVVVNWTAGLGR